jgi:hypothetical protein
MKNLGTVWAEIKTCHGQSKIIDVLGRGPGVHEGGGDGKAGLLRDSNLCCSSVHTGRHEHYWIWQAFYILSTWVPISVTPFRAY